MKIVERPSNLSEWVLFSYEGDIEKFGNMITHGSVGTQYVKKIARAERPYINLHQKKRGKYKWIVEFDMAEGFSNNNKVLTEYAAKYIPRILQSANSVDEKRGTTSESIHTLGYAYYSDLDEAVKIANQLADLDQENFLDFVSGEIYQDFWKESTTHSV